MKLIIATTCAALLSMSAGASAAQTEGDLRRASASYADLDLSRESGRATLERRIGFAVERVCGPRPSPPQFDAMRNYRTCRATAWAGAKEQLAAIYGRRMLAEGSIKVVAGAN
jgi:UrcA family protein